MVRGEDDLPSLCPVRENGRMTSSHCDECEGRTTSPRWVECKEMRREGRKNSPRCDSVSARKRGQREDNLPSL